MILPVSRNAALEEIKVETNAKKHPEYAFIKKLNSVIEEHMDDNNFEIPQLSKAMCMSRSQLHLKTKALTKRSASHYVRAIRLQRAKQLLAEGKMNVTQVSMEVGFTDRTYYSKAFHKEFGASPSEFINKK